MGIKKTRGNLSPPVMALLK